jgi:hypothetical protein
MKQKKKAITKFLSVFSVFLMVLTATSMAIPLSSAAGSIALNPLSGAPSSSVTVTGIGFAPNTVVGIGFGKEVAVVDDVHPIRSGTTIDCAMKYAPIVPGSWSMSISIEGGNVVLEVAENGLGDLTSTNGPFGTMNYAQGTFHREGVAETGGTYLHTASYTRYQYSVTPSIGITTNASGSFSANITIPGTSDGTYAVTAADAKGNHMSSNFSVSTQPIPEGFSAGFVMLLSVFAVLFGSRYLGKFPKDKNATIR